MAEKSNLNQIESGERARLVPVTTGKRAESSGIWRIPATQRARRGYARNKTRGPA